MNPSTPRRFPLVNLIAIAWLLAGLGMRASFEFLQGPESPPAHPVILDARAKLHGGPREIAETLNDADAVLVKPTPE